ncbi:hypothetical protein ACF0H5_023161 [Mactra antiquata]
MYTDARVVHPYKPNDNVTLQELNEELFVLHIPALVFVVFSITIGCIGNSFVLLVYKKKFRRSNHRYFILFLAAVDLVACVIGMPFLVASLRLPYLMFSTVLCKVMRYNHYLVNNSSGLLLLVISIERYRKICHPLKKQLNTRQILFLCYGTIFISAIIAIPAPIFYEASDIDTKIGNLTGKQCYVEKSVKSSILFEMFQGLLLIESIVCMVVILILYFLIALKLWTSDRFVNSMKSTKFNSALKNLNEASFSTDNHLHDDDTSDSCNANKINHSRAHGPEVALLKHKHRFQELRQHENESRAKSASCNALNNADEGLAISTTGIHKSKPDVSSESGANDSSNNLKRPYSELALNKEKNLAIFSSLRSLAKRTVKTTTSTSSNNSNVKNARGSRTTVRVTVMLFVVSIVFIFAFIPHLVLMIVTVEFDGFLESLDAPAIMAYQIFLRIFIINNIANPIIYVIFDAKFREACKTLIVCASCRKTA